jgi:hypothetical protein
MTSQRSQTLKKIDNQGRPQYIPHHQRGLERAAVLRSDLSTPLSTTRATFPSSPPISPSKFTKRYPAPLNPQDRDLQ